MEMELRENLNEQTIAKKEYSKMGIAFFVMTVATIIIQTILILAIENIPAISQNFDITTIILTGSFYPVGYIILYSMLGAKNKELPKIEKNKMSKKRFFQMFTLSYFLMIAGNIIGLVSTEIIASFKGEAVDNVLVETMNTLSPVVSLILAVILAPIFEEIFFRKFLIDRIHMFGKVPAIVVSGLMFGLFHANLNQFFYAFFLGMILSYVYLNYGDIKICIGLHMLINSIGFIVTVIYSQIDLETLELIQTLEPSSPQDAEIIMQYAGPILGMAAITIIIPVLVIMGFISYIKNLKTFKSYKAYSKQTEKITTVKAISNIGIILFILITAGQIMLQLFL